MPSSPAPKPASDREIASARAELSVVGDTIDRHRDRVAGLAEPFLGTDREDVVAVLHEAERQLNMAVRTLRRAVGVLGS